MLPSPGNLVRWCKTSDNKCRSGAYGSMRHISAKCHLGLAERYTWRHNQVLEIIMKALKGKIKDINQGKLPKKSVLNKVDSHPKRKKWSYKAQRTEQADVRWEGNWKTPAYQDNHLFPIVVLTAPRLGGVE